MKNYKNILPIALLVTGTLTGFGGGYYFRNYQFSKNRGNFMTFNGNAQGQRFMGANGSVRGSNGNRMMGGVGAVDGEIISSDDKSVTVKLPDGSTKIVLLSDTTIYTNSQTAKKEDLKNGTKVAIFGRSNSDGSVTAERVQLNPIIITATPTPK